MDNTVTKTIRGDAKAVGTKDPTEIAEEQTVLDSVPEGKEQEVAQNRRILKDTTKLKKTDSVVLKKYRIFPSVNGSHYTSLRKASAIDPELDEYKKSSTLRTGY